MLQCRLQTPPKTPLTKTEIQAIRPHPHDPHYSVKQHQQEIPYGNNQDNILSATKSAAIGRHNTRYLTAITRRINTIHPSRVTNNTNRGKNQQQHQKSESIHKKNNKHRNYPIANSSIRLQNTRVRNRNKNDKLSHSNTSPSREQPRPPLPSLCTIVPIVHGKKKITKMETKASTHVQCRV
eukprot:14496190-Ditylum_brightwellii.AAC.1